ncbi:hypothetical protein GH984_09075 [Spiribacter sp. C176]|uniref:Uncharacterized protein n=1 Tax=Spiribacter salilacus TaxID=2664894 RepID=A0A6N7QTX5_9GAMM|nr:hypothetical protein [Spiribacter salilacus]MRH78859.1 hypothetical protein [Spiribacter salilacus]
MKQFFSAVLLSVALATTAQASDIPENPAEIEQELRTLQERLSAAREQAMTANPKLQKRQEALQDEVMSRMRDEGVFPRRQIREIQDMASELSGGELAEEEREVLLAEYQVARDELLAARRTALEDERIIASQRAFSDELMNAMLAVDPQADEMAERFEVLREALSALRAQ